MSDLSRNGHGPERYAARARAMLTDFPHEAAEKAAALIAACYEGGGKVLVCGNGGSAMEAQHLVAELVGKFERDRASLPALALHQNPASLTAVANDYGYDDAFAHQVEALGAPGDVLVAISTSGSSENVARAVLAAREKGLATVGYLGGGGNRLGPLMDVPVTIGAPDTATIQAGHLVLTHTICGLVEEALFSNKAVFVDRDGTLIVNRHYGSDPDRIELLDGVADGLRALRGAGYKLVLVSNQSGVARGYFDEAAIGRMHDRLQKMLDAHGAALDGLEYCPHHPEGEIFPYAVECACRKPAPGMLRRAARKHGLNLSASWMVGDIAADVEAGKRAGARTVLVGPEPSPLPPDFRAAGFREVVGHILGEGVGGGLGEKAGSAAGARL
ncbi:HAD-IIIA family hydrolase [Rubrobacter marinus]|uniref:HAD-IIIA family hydrolase n=1 Tax=Rubrobacter marinus TaxID=2653852 RepID=UPI00140B3DB9|nr:HAD-IIIA family hydrolase [Rubrobacter marinus]